MPNGSGVRWAECLQIIGTGCRVQVFVWSSKTQSVCQQAFTLLASRCLRPWVRILHSAEVNNLSPFDSNIACLCQSIEINNNKHVYRQSQVRMPTGSEVEWAECLLIIGTGCRVQVFAWSSIAQSVCQQALSLLANRCLRPSGFESCLQQRKTTCLLLIRKSLACARASKLTKTNNNKHVYRQCQVRKPTGSEVEWAECLLIIGTGCRVQVFAWSSIAQSVCQQAFSLLPNRCLRPSGFESCLQQRKTTCLLSIWISLACARASKLTTTNVYIARARCECQMAVGSGGLNAYWS